MESFDRTAERQHQVFCTHCRRYYDCRNLQESFRHEHLLFELPHFPFSYSVKFGPRLMVLDGYLPVTIN